MSEPATFTCPVCRRTSYNPNDARYRWCGACEGYTEAEPPPGMRWFLFRGGSLDNVGRLIEETRVPDFYERIPTGERYELRDDEFVLLGGR